MLFLFKNSRTKVQKSTFKMAKLRDAILGSENRGDSTSLYRAVKAGFSFIEIMFIARGIIPAPKNTNMGLTPHIVKNEDMGLLFFPSKRKENRLQISKAKPEVYRT